LLDCLPSQNVGLYSRISYWIGTKIFATRLLMFADELQNVAVEGVGRLPGDRVGGLGQHDELGAGISASGSFWVGSIDS
jgi:hypothetical protein